MQESHGGDYSKPFVFSAFNRTLEDGKLYTLDPCPNEWYAYWCAQVVNGLCSGQPNDALQPIGALHRHLAMALVPPVRRRSSLGLDAFRDAGLLHDFEDSKREFIGRHATTPVLLVQGPPGTGKSYCTAFAVFARLQGAMQEKGPYRVFLSCKTHAATDVLLANVLEVQQKLRELQAAEPKLFAKHFDVRLLDVPIYRVAPKDQPPAWCDCPGAKMPKRKRVKTTTPT